MHNAYGTTVNQFFDGRCGDNGEDKGFREALSF